MELTGPHVSASCTDFPSASAVVNAEAKESPAPVAIFATQSLYARMPSMTDTRIIFNKNIRHGKPVIKGTRITVEEILGALAGGMTYAEIAKEYGVTREGILAAIRYAAGWFQGEEIIPLTKMRA